MCMAASSRSLCPLTTWFSALLFGAAQLPCASVTLGDRVAILLTPHPSCALQSWVTWTTSSAMRMALVEARHSQAAALCSSHDQMLSSIIPLAGSWQNLRCLCFHF
ncbi:hypothetical protein DFH06DRAFT_1167936 [Mycena polygramma]|nr:hypothetical protein DFH06DRAFT_1167936 [Mycena polygramma]